MNTSAEVVVDTDGELLLQRIKKAKDVRAVQKARFATFISAIPENINIFSFEGPDDRVIYYTWINKLAGNLRYEAYQCNGKKQVLQLFDILSEDETGLGNRVYYFVDHDFDGLQGRDKSERVFLTEKYSVENYVVCEKVLDDILNLSFHCNGEIALRQNVVDKFRKAYEEFLNASKDLNFRIYLARYYKIEMANLPSSLHGYLEVHLEGVTLTGADLSSIVQLKYEPTDEQKNKAKKDFENLIPKYHFRGKFSVSFFIKWLGLLRTDRLSANPVIFSGVEAPKNSIGGDFSFNYLASKSRPPRNLENFLRNIVSDFDKKTGVLEMIE